MKKNIFLFLLFSLVWVGTAQAQKTALYDKAIAEMNQKGTKSIAFTQDGFEYKCYYVIGAKDMTVWYATLIDGVKSLTRYMVPFNKVEKHSNVQVSELTQEKLGIDHYTVIIYAQDGYQFVGILNGDMKQAPVKLNPITLYFDKQEAAKAFAKQFKKSAGVE